ncbi:MAG: sensor histidine kinase [Alphaproteobacteria bacterium]|nr:sensor histidine kinase [Alphaproteobacteria bacterium]
MTAAMLLVGSWVSSRIEQAVVQNSASTAALFMESFVSPLGQELAQHDALSEPAKRALTEIFEGTALGERVVSYKIWKPGGLIVHASDPSLIGRTFEPSDDLIQAWSGRIAASYEDLTDLEDQYEASLGIPLLEVYSPIREVWTGRIIAVAEFYERVGILDEELSDARRNSWLVVASTFLASGLLLFGIVQTGGRTIRDQRKQLETQLEETRAVSQQNLTLRKRVVSASSRATAETERTIRRIGFDLHDGPAQYLALAALRLDGALPDQESVSRDAKEVRKSLEKALSEIRAISRGLALPDLDALDLKTLVRRAIEEHEHQTDMTVGLTFVGQDSFPLDFSQKVCVYRFLQETLSNSARHADVADATVVIETTSQTLTILVKDQGRGFEPDTALKLRQDGGQGLLGLMDRAQSIGGNLTIQSRPGDGTTMHLTLSNVENST